MKIYNMTSICAGQKIAAGHANPGASALIGSCPQASLKCVQRRGLLLLPGQRLSEDEPGTTGGIYDETGKTDW